MKHTVHVEFIISEEQYKACMDLAELNGMDTAEELFHSILHHAIEIIEEEL